MCRSSPTPKKEKDDHVGQPGDFPKNRSHKGKGDRNNRGHRLCQDAVRQITCVLIAHVRQKQAAFATTLLPEHTQEDLSAQETENLD